MFKAGDVVTFKGQGKYFSDAKAASYGEVTLVEGGSSHSGKPTWWCRSDSRKGEFQAYEEIFVPTGPVDIKDYL